MPSMTVLQSSSNTTFYEPSSVTHWMASCFNFNTNIQRFRFINFFMTILLAIFIYSNIDKWCTTKGNENIYIMEVFNTSMTSFLFCSLWNICKFNIIKASTQRRIHAYLRMKLLRLYHQDQSGCTCNQ